MIAPSFSLWERFFVPVRQKAPEIIMVRFNAFADRDLAVIGDDASGSVQ